MTELTPRQAEIAELTEKGFTRKQIGDMLYISPGTVKVLAHRAARRRPDLARTWRAVNLAAANHSKPVQPFDTADRHGAVSIPTRLGI
jgi:DNA-binding CsgD family transcriptional regulator